MRAHGSGALSEVDGRNFMMLLDMCHYLVDTITQQHNFPNVQAASQLRVTRTDLTAMLSRDVLVLRLGAGRAGRVRAAALVGEAAAGGRGRHPEEARGGGVLGGRRDGARAPPAGRERAAALAAPARHRHLLLRQGDGLGAAVLVDQRTQKVYEVLGISTSIGDIMRSGGRFTKDDVLGATIKLTLLPYMAKIVYDGTLFGAPPAGASEAAEARAAAEAAEAEGTVLRELPAHVESLVGKRVDISGLRAARAQRHDGHRDGVGRGEGAVRRPPRRRRDGGAQDGQPGGVVAAGGLEIRGGRRRRRSSARPSGRRRSGSELSGSGRATRASGPFGGWGTPRPRIRSTSPPSLAATARWSAWCLRAPRSRPPPTRS